MGEIILKYGCNPYQTPARIFTEGKMPLEILNGRPGYINFMDALNAWQLVRELRDATGLPSASSFKHVSPAGAAVSTELTQAQKRSFFAGEGEISPIASAYIAARGSDRVSSYGDFIALSDVCDESCAAFIALEVSDGIIAPGYTPGALEILKSKRKGSYSIIKIDPGYTPPETERRNIFGLTFEQGRNNVKIDRELLGDIVTKNKALPPKAELDLIIAMITLKYTQSNSVCYAFNGMTTGIGAGQQNRVDCVRLAGSKADKWWLRQHEKTLSLEFLDSVKRYDMNNIIDAYVSGAEEEILADGVWQTIFKTRPESLSNEEKQAFITSKEGVSIVSDAFFPFGDSIERAHRSGVSYVAQPGGSLRDDLVIETCDKYSMVMCFNKTRLFHH